VLRRNSAPLLNGSPRKQKRVLELGRAAAPNANLRPTRDVKSLLELGPHDAGKDISL
jgi:hypothetical protein